MHLILKLFLGCLHNLSLSTFSINKSLTKWDLDCTAAKVVLRLVSLQGLVAKVHWFSWSMWSGSILLEGIVIEFLIHYFSKKGLQDFIDVNLSFHSAIKENWPNNLLSWRSTPYPNFKTVQWWFMKSMQIFRSINKYPDYWCTHLGETKLHQSNKASPLLFHHV
jgi:hypothetical protein